MSVEISHCTKVFALPGRESLRALDDVSITIPDGQIVAVLGSNGAGKSTLLSLVAGSLLPDSGHVVIDGLDVTTMPAWRRVRHLARVRQNPEHSVFPALTLEENFAIALSGQRRFRLVPPRRAEVRRLATESLTPFGLGLEKRLDTLAGTFSGGQRQAAAVAMALLGNAKLILLDEHTAALDPRSARLVSDETERGIRRAGMSAMMVTHDMTHALERSDRILMMHRGKVILDITGCDKEALDAAGLVDRFELLTGGGQLSDRDLLSGR
jgi:putative tryptophan/tyrosine transport system ATP-binding protein